MLYNIAKSRPRNIYSSRNRHTLIIVTYFWFEWRDLSKRTIIFARALFII